MKLIYLVLTNIKGKITSITYNLVDENGTVATAEYKIGNRRAKDTFTLSYALQAFSECFTNDIEAIPTAPEHYFYLYKAFSYVKNGKALRAKFEQMNHRPIKAQAA